MKKTIVTLMALSGFANAQSIFPDQIRPSDLAGISDAAINSVAGYSNADLGAATGLAYLSGVSINIQGDGGLHPTSDQFQWQSGEALTFTFGSAIPAELFGNPSLGANEGFGTSGLPLVAPSAFPAGITTTGTSWLNSGAGQSHGHSFLNNSTVTFTGTHIGTASNANYTLRTIDPASVPEPSSAILLGLTGLGFLARRKRA